MDYISVVEAAKKWGISDALVRRHCRDNRIPDAVFRDGAWLIPANCPKPGRVPYTYRVEDLPIIAKRLTHQKTKKNFHGLYDYVQIYLTYSSCRLASNRLTRNQVESIFRKGKVRESFEPMKVSDCVEVLNHCICVDSILDNISVPLSENYIKKLHYDLTLGSVDVRKCRVVPGVYRTVKMRIPHKESPSAREISGCLLSLISEYEAVQEIELKHILDFHVRFERIAPFQDGNGRVGRLIMFKECLRHDVMPFIIDDKHRKHYLDGIKNWDVDRFGLLEVAYAAQERFEKIVDRCKLGEYRQKEFQDMYAAFEEELPVEDLDAEVPKKRRGSTSQNKQRKRRG